MGDITKLFTMPRIDADPCAWFRDDEKEQERLDREESICENAWREIVEAPGFKALTFTEEGERGDTLYLHHSTRPEGKYQLSYVNWDGVPAMHDLYGPDRYRETEEYMYRRLTHFCIKKDVKVRALFAA